MSPITNPAELRRCGMEVLVRELGYVNAMRFLHQYETGYGDYTRDRHAFLDSQSVDEMVGRADALVPPGIGHGK